LPLLPSLLPREAFAQAAVAPRRMMLLYLNHNNLNSIWPSPTEATTAVGNSGARERLLTSMGSMSSHSPAMNNARYESLKNANLISIVRGFDIYHGAGHGNGVIAAAQDRNSEGNFPTIDTIVEASRSVYPLNTPVTVQKAIRIRPDYGSDFFRKVGNSVERLPGYYGGDDLRRFYNDVFSSLTVGTVPTQDLSNQLKSNILNRVYSSFTNFKNSGRMSSDDNARLTQHMDYISDLQRSMASIPTPQSPACVKPNEPNGANDPAVFYGLYLELLAAAFKCGLTKFSVMGVSDPSWVPSIANPFSGDIHGAFHGQGGAAIQREVQLNYWRYYSNLLADRFLVHLDQQEGNTGRTYIDNMITGVICGGGFAAPGTDGGHNGVDSQQILIGSMGGRLRAGRYMTVPRSQTGDQSYVGDNLPYNCFLITLLQLMGVTPAEYAFATPDGQGIGYYGAFGANYPRRNRFYQPVTELLT
ncbi:DUF1552 domain-containing protein, partial [bacterium]|nr:DUF1552 domain-containing protein [bacterium]